MKVYLSPKSLLIVSALCLVSLTSGCVFDQRDQEMYMQRQREESLTAQEEMRRIRSRLESLEQDMMRLSKFVNESSSDQSLTMQTQIQAMNASMDELQSQIRQVDANRERDKKEVVNALSEKMAAMMKSAPRNGGSSRSSRPISGEGYEHVVESGETISAIAKAYGVSAQDIVRANNMQSADLLYIGQKLFIPAP